MQATPTPGGSETPKYSDVRHLKICHAKGIHISRESTILDFGCGEGRRVYQLRDMGYRHVYGYNKANYLGIDNSAKLRRPQDAEWFKSSTRDVVPWPDNFFDLIISDQVLEHVSDQESVFREMYRVLKPGGVAVHVMPAKWMLIEPHILVPFGGFKPFQRYAYFWVWAMLGLRNPWQRGKSPDAVATSNTHYSRNSLNYLSCRQYRKLLRVIPFRHSWEELTYMQASFRPKVQRLAWCCERIPGLVSLIRTFKQRTLFLQKV